MMNKYQKKLKKIIEKIRLLPYPFNFEKKKTDLELVFFLFTFISSLCEFWFKIHFTKSITISGKFHFMDQRNSVYDKISRKTTYFRCISVVYNNEISSISTNFTSQIFFLLWNFFDGFFFSWTRKIVYQLSEFTKNSESVNSGIDQKGNKSSHNHIKKKNLDKKNWKKNKKEIKKFHQQKGQCRIRYWHNMFSKSTVWYHKFEINKMINQLHLDMHICYRWKFSNIWNGNNIKSSSSPSVKMKIHNYIQLN